ncbi:nitrilase-related carbon-nitrogen hydrolase [Limibacillus halophilus]|uniref:Putative amidohydrolase n=1 Tax=Limibacillus halophilus TaxID=1579333 RepID=A0A839SRS1_9PROT|nr:nitrilase-related carbon-nitrogen hydrolase [Limibacillus halophilus]MBB3064410.1 putative amidohydrolase [Limibacillus halophilus]
MNQRSNGMTVAVAQIECHPGALAENLEKHLEMISKARAAGAELLLFPELSLCGYEVAGRVLDVAMSRDDPRLVRLAEAAGDMRVVVGLVEEGIAAQFHNSAFLLERGRVAFIHRKLNLPTYGNLEEGKHFAAGRYLESFELEDRRWRCGVLICADCWNPALVHLAAVQGITLLLLPVASAMEALGGDFSNPTGWRKALEFYGMIYGLPLLFANHCGGKPGMAFWGGSRILDAYGEAVAEAGDGEELLVADLDYEQVKRARYLLPTLRDSNLDLIRRELERQKDIVGVPPESREV